MPINSMLFDRISEMAKSRRNYITSQILWSSPLLKAKIVPEV